MTESQNLDPYRKILKNLTMADLKGGPRTDQAKAEKITFFAGMLSRYSEQAVAKACREWIENQSGWPAIAELLKSAGEYESLATPARPAISHGPSSAESLVERLERLRLKPTLLEAATVRAWNWLLGSGHRDLSDDELHRAVISRGEAKPDRMRQSSAFNERQRRPMAPEAVKRMTDTLMRLRQRPGPTDVITIRMGEDMIEHGEWR